MSTSKQTFDQVKSILGKLDRFIDAARARRLEPHPSPASLSLEPTPGRSADPTPAVTKPMPGQTSGEPRLARPMRQEPMGGPSPLLATRMDPRPH